METLSKKKEEEAKKIKELDDKFKKEAKEKETAAAPKIEKDKATVSDAIKQVSAVTDQVTKIEEKKTFDFKKQAEQMKASATKKESDYSDDDWDL